MPIELQFLKKVDFSLVGFAALLLIAIAGTVGMTWHLATLRSAVNEFQQELDQKQSDADRVVMPTEEELAQWATAENVLVSRLVTQNEVATFLADFQRLGRQFGLTVLVGTSEVDVPQEGEDEPLSDRLARDVGIRRYTELTLNFSGDYEDTARYVQTVGSLPRLIEFTSITHSRNHPDVDVTLVLRVYKREDDA